MSSFPERLKEIRKINKMTQKQVFNGIGIGERLYQRYEHGQIDPSYKIIVKLADFFQISTDYLLGREDLR